jgi:hypothetical protein
MENSMGFLKGLMSFLKGDFVKNAMDFVNTRWPPNMSESDKAQMELVITDMLHKQAMDLAAVAQKDEAAFNQRIVDLEGTAHDLKSIPFIGALIIFLRGAFRPMFAYMVAYVDWLYFTTDTAHWPEQQQTLLIAINLLVLAFFFGERAMKNVMPLITSAIAAKVAK